MTSRSKAASSRSATRRQRSSSDGSIVSTTGDLRTRSRGRPNQRQIGPHGAVCAARSPRSPSLPPPPKNLPDEIRRRLKPARLHARASLKIFLTRRPHRLGRGGPAPRLRAGTCGWLAPGGPDPGDGGGGRASGALLSGYLRPCFGRGAPRTPVEWAAPRLAGRPGRGRARCGPHLARVGEAHVLHYEQQESPHGDGHELGGVEEERKAERVDAADAEERQRQHRRGLEHTDETGARGQADPEPEEGED